jgi:hypothetical protein
MATTMVRPEPGRIDQRRDLNGDGHPDAVIVEGGLFCYGNTGAAFWIVAGQANGGWKLMANEVGIPVQGGPWGRWLAGHRGRRPRLLLSGDPLEWDGLCPQPPGVRRQALQATALTRGWRIVLTGFPFPRARDYSARTMDAAKTLTLPADWRDFFALTKPRVMTLVIFTGLCGLLAAPGASIPCSGFTAILCIAVGAGGPPRSTSGGKRTSTRG